MDNLLKIQFAKTKSIKINENSFLKLSIPNRLSYLRAETFFSKEPETIDWLDEINEGSIFWDIGANVGLYSLYAAQQKNSSVIAFEPSVFNLELLARNISYNNLDSHITIFPLALSDKESEGLFNMSNPDWGGALSTFNQKFDQYGFNMNINFKYRMMGVSGDFIVKNMNIKQPEYLKIDVDGAEHILLSGMKNILPYVKSVLVEINDNFEAQSITARDILVEAGFTLKKKCLQGVPKGLNIYNQWWNNQNLE